MSSVEEAVAGPAPLWRNRDFMVLWGGQLLSTTGSRVSRIAFPLLVLAVFGSAEVAGVAAALASVPYLLFSLPAGALLDRWDRRRVMVVCDAVRAVNMASIPLALLLGALTVSQIYIVAFIEGSMAVFFEVAQMAALPRVVPKAQLAQANSQNQVATSTAMLVGPSVGGVLFSLGAFIPFLFDAVSYVVSFVSLLFIRTRFQLEHAPGRRNMRAEVGEGLHWLWRHPVLRFIAFITGSVNFALSADQLLVIVLAKSLGAGEAEIGAIFSAGAVGALLGAAVSGWLQRRFALAQLLIAPIGLLAICFPLRLLAPNLLLLGAVNMVMVLAVPIASVTLSTYRQTLVPDELQGRVTSSFRLIGNGFQPLGATLAGVLLQSFGLVPADLLFSATLLLTVLALMINRELKAATAAGH